MKNNLKKIIILPLLTLVITGCNNTSEESKHEHTFDKLVVTRDADWHTFIAGSDFDDSGLEVKAECSVCKARKKVSYTLENNQNLELGQNSVTIKYENLSLSYDIVVKEKYHLACLGDSLTYGHMWQNQAYPVYLSNLVSDKYDVGNFSYNGLSITGYGGSFDNPDERYIKRNEYKQSLEFAPDIIAIMLGTNDATGWTNAQDIFEDEYRVLLDSYLELFPDVRVIMMVSPPCISPNQFSIPNDIIKENVNPIQRDLADDYGFEVLDLREEFEEVEGYESKYLRPNDGVHFTVEGAEYVASRVWDIAKDLTF